MPAFALGTPGNDRQPQAMLQALLNVVEFGMSPQAAVEAPRVASFGFPARPNLSWKSGGVCVIQRDLATGVLKAGADPRRESCAAAY